MATKNPATKVRVDHLNRALRAGTDRAADLEEKLAALLVPILDRAADTAARAFSATATDHLATPVVPAAGVTAAAANPRSTMVALYPRPDEAAALEHAGGEPAGILHVTLAYLGETDGPLEQVAEVLRPVASGHAALEGAVAGIGAFADNGDGHPIILLPDVGGLVELRQAVCEALAAASVDYSRDHGYTAHVTVAYADEPATPSPEMFGQPLHFDELVLVRGDTERMAIQLVGPRPVTAAGNPGWTAPAADELVDVAALVANLRTKTDPVRLAAIEATMTEALAAAGLAFDVTNPFTAKVLAQAGSQISHIASTTQANVMRVIASAYEEGLSIPDTAKAIQAGMRAANPARATLIARTELAGAVNGGSLAATQIVSAATGDKYYKAWLTAGGAKFPRHETYGGLDGQTVPLDDTFAVGGFDLEFPADPDGPPEEVCNCRCTMEYTDSIDGTDLAAPEGIDAPDEIGDEELSDSGIGGQIAAQEMLGDSLAVEAGAPVDAFMVDLGKVPAEVIDACKRNGVTWHAGKRLSDQDDLGRLAGVKPGAWAKKGSTWDDVAGVYSPRNKVVAMGSEGSGASFSTAIHETAHAFEDAAGLAGDEQLVAAHRRLFSSLNPYLQQGSPGSLAGRRELFAEGVATYITRGRPAAVALFDARFVAYLERVVPGLAG